MKKGMKRYYTSILTAEFGQLYTYIIRIFYATDEKEAWEKAYKIAENYPNGVVYDARTGGKIWIPEGMKGYFNYE